MRLIRFGIKTFGRKELHLNSRSFPRGKWVTNVRLLIILTVVHINEENTICRKKKAKNES